MTDQPRQKKIKNDWIVLEAGFSRLKDKYFLVVKHSFFKKKLYYSREYLNNNKNINNLIKDALEGKSVYEF
jgi:hypothetical protein